MRKPFTLALVVAMLAAFGAEAATTNGSANSVVKAANGGTGVSSVGTPGNILQATLTGWSSAANPSFYVTNRAPTATDDTSLGYAIGDYWAWGSSIWKSSYVASGQADWINQLLSGANTLDIVPNAIAAYGVCKKRSAYSGYAFQVTEFTGSTTLDVPFINGNPFTFMNCADFALVDNFCFGKYCGVSKIYDQAGGGYDLAQATPGNMPRLVGDSVNGIRAISFNSSFGAFTMNNTSLPITNVRNVSIFLTGRHEFSEINDGIMELGNPTAKLSLYSAAGGSVTTLPGGSYSKQFAVNPTTTMLVTNGSSAPSLRMNSVTATGTAPTSSAATGIIFGTTFGSTYGGYDLIDLIVYDSTLSAANQDLAFRAEVQGMGILPQIKDTLSFVGDSITQWTSGTYGGTGALDAPDGSYITQTMNALKRPYNIYNFGHAGIGTGSAPSTSLMNRVFVTGANNIIVYALGTNDLAAKASTATTYSNIQTTCAAYRTAGFKVIVATILPRNNIFSGGQNTAGFAADRATVNASIVANWASFADGLVDIGADPIMGPNAAADDSTLYRDSVHPTTPLGNSYLAKDMKKAIETLIQ